MKEFTILIVDDEPINLKVLIKLLQPNYHVLVANSGRNAFQILAEQPLPDMILLDVMMPEMSGYEVCERLKENPLTAHIPVIFVTAKNDEFSEEKGFRLGAVDYIAKPIVPFVVLARVETHLALYDQNRSLETKVLERTRQLQETRLKIIQRLGRAAEYKDNETGMHVIRMAHYSRMLAQARGLESGWVERLYNAAPMHDVGKIGIPDRILLKPGKLDPDEWAIIKTHAAIGAEIIGDADGSTLLEMAASVALTHHEKWNGSGYPNGLAGEAIPMEGRIVAIADVFDALTSVRPYKEAWPVEDAQALVANEAGEHFDPELVPLFLDLIPEIKKIMASHSDAVP